MKIKSQILNYFIEIVIIIVGVLIAFYLTKYGENLNRNKNEKDILSQISIELEADLQDLERDLVKHRIGLEGNLRAIQFLDRKRELSDSLIMDFYWMTKDEYVFPNTSGYENLKAIGVNLIKDDSLRQMVTSVYNGNFSRISVGNTLNPDIGDYLNPFFEKHFRLNTDTSKTYSLNFEDTPSITYPRKIGLGVYQTIGYIPLNKEALLENEKFRFLISNSLEYRMYKFIQYQRCIGMVRMTIDRIKEKI